MEVIPGHVEAGATSTGIVPRSCDVDAADRPKGIPGIAVAASRIPAVAGIDKISARIARRRRAGAGASARRLASRRHTDAAVYEALPFRSPLANAKRRLRRRTAGGGLRRTSRDRAGWRGSVVGVVDGTAGRERDLLQRSLLLNSRQREGEISHRVEVAKISKSDLPEKGDGHRRGRVDTVKRAVTQIRVVVAVAGECRDLIVEPEMLPCGSKDRKVGVVQDLPVNVIGVEIRPGKRDRLTQRWQGDARNLPWIVGVVADLKNDIAQTVLDLRQAITRRIQLNSDRRPGELSEIERGAARRTRRLKGMSEGVSASIGELDGVGRGG